MDYIGQRNRSAEPRSTQQQAQATGNVPSRNVSPPSPPAPRPYQSPAPEGKKPTPKSRRFSLKLIVPAIVAVIAILLALWFFVFSGSGNVASSIDGSKNQAVFFTNGQVYFGKLKAINDDYFQLTEVFYLQSNGGDAANSENPQESTSDEQNDVELIKLGAELHGPEDKMMINKDQMLFFENLKDDSKVSESIKQFESN